MAATPAANTPQGPLEERAKPVPEIPDLEAIRGFLAPVLGDNPVSGVEAPQPWLVRTGAAELDTLRGHAFVDVRRYGKFLLFSTDDGRVLVVNPMLTGRFHWAEGSEARRPAPALVLGFDDGHELRYADQRRMGRIYLVAIDALDSVPQFGELGPDALEIEEDEFVERLRRRGGQIKNTLTNQQFVAGIGNAYADEILWEARLHPHRRGSTLDDDDRRELYRAMRAVFDWARPILEAHVQDGLKQRKEEWRDQLRVHRKAGQACPRCGREVRGRTSGSRETNFCLNCQPLDLERRTAAGAAAGGGPGDETQRGRVT